MPILDRRLVPLAEAPLGRLLVRYSWPALVSMALNALYAVVDRFYIGCGCGADAMAGMAMALPVTMLFTAFGVWIGAGHSAILSIKLGANDRATCEKCLGQLVAYKLLFFLLLPPLVFFNLDAVLGWCGGAKLTPGALAAGKTYLQLGLFFNVFAHLAFGFSAMMRAEGAAIRSMTCMVVGFTLNLVLDPLFIFGLRLPTPWGTLVLPAWGIAGAAWATNVSMVVSCLWAAAYYLRGKSTVRLRLDCIRLHRGISLRAMTIGLPPFLQNLMGAAINMSLAAAFAHWATDAAAARDQIASLGVFQSALILSFMPILGSQQGLAPIYGYNWGARNFPRLRDAFKLGFVVTTALCVLACVVQTVPPFPRWIASMFVDGANTALREHAARDLAISNSMIWCISVNVMATTYFQAIGRPWVAIVLSMLRQGVVLLPCVFLLPLVMEDKVFAIWLALPLSDVICQITTLPPLLHHFAFLRRAANSPHFIP